MRAVQVTPEAKADLVSIADYISKDNRTAAIRMLDAFEECFHRLANLPEIGHRRSDVTDKQYRFWNVRSYVIGYRFDDATVTIVRVVHGARYMRKLLR